MFTAPGCNECSVMKDGREGLLLSSCPVAQARTSSFWPEEQERACVAGRWTPLEGIKMTSLQKQAHSSVLHPPLPTKTNHTRVFWKKNKQ